VGPRGQVGQHDAAGDAVGADPVRPELDRQVRGLRSGRNEDVGSGLSACGRCSHDVERHGPHLI
jgi:hypothetical protein